MGLFVWIGFATAAANLEVVKTVELFGLTATLGNIMYGSNVFCDRCASMKDTDKQEAKKAVSIGFFNAPDADVCHAGRAAFQAGIQKTSHKLRWRRYSASCRAWP